MEKLSELGIKLKAAREKKGLTQQQLADLTHVSKKHIQNCERGLKNPSFEILCALIPVLDVSLDSLIDPRLSEEDEGANEMRRIYLSCPPAVREALLNSTRSLSMELKKLAQESSQLPIQQITTQEEK